MLATYNVFPAILANFNNQLLNDQTTFHDWSLHLTIINKSSSWLPPFSIFSAFGINSLHGSGIKGVGGSAAEDDPWIHRAETRVDSLIQSHTLIKYARAGGSQGRRRDAPKVCQVIINQVCVLHKQCIIQMTFRNLLQGRKKIYKKTVSYFICFCGVRVVSGGE